MEPENMLFLVNSRIPQGVSREQVVEYLTRPVAKEAWGLIKSGVIAHWMFKVGDQPGIAFVMDCASLEQARELVDASSMVRDGVLEFEIDRVNHFPRFA
jgi:hypothetical protein